MKKRAKDWLGDSYFDRRAAKVSAVSRRDRDKKLKELEVDDDQPERIDEAEALRLVGEIPWGYDGEA